MNVIVIVADELRRDYLGCYGNDWIKTPNIDRLASEATVFDYAYSESVTIPIRTSWFTGKYIFPFRDWQRLEPTDVLLSELLWNKAYTSALITDTYHMHEPQMGFSRGFDYVQHIRGQEYDPYIIDKSIKVDVDKIWKDDGEGKWPKERERQYLRNISQMGDWQDDENHFAGQVFKAGIKWISSQKKKDNLFLWLDCYDPHEPWDPPKPYVKMYDPHYKGKDIIDPIPRLVEGYLSKDELKHISCLYAGEISMVDKWVGIFLSELKRLEFFENSLIIFISDHGEPLGGHGIIRKCRPWPYQELVRVPFILRHPSIGHGKRIDVLVEMCDLMPTILDFLGILEPQEIPYSSGTISWDPKRIHGKSVLPCISGKTEKLRDYVHIGYYRRCWCIKNYEWSYMFWFKSKLYPDIWPPQLYNLKDDPEEKKNVIRDYPEIAKKLELELRRFVADLQEKERNS